MDTKTDGKVLYLSAAKIKKLPHTSFPGKELIEAFIFTLINNHTGETINEKNLLKVYGDVLKKTDMV